jgi:hypothetical protein
MIYLLTASGLPAGGSCTVHIYTQTIHRTTQNKQYIEQHKIWAQHKIWEQISIIREVKEGKPGRGCKSDAEKLNIHRNLIRKSVGRTPCTREK